MVFSNLIFLYLFLPANILLYYVTKNPAWRNGVLIVFSLFFYAWGEPVWVTLLIFSATIDYFHGLICEKYAGRWQAKAALGSSLVLNLGLLGIFKYSGMLVESINGLTGLSLPVPGFSLPIGISFYTFQTISYVIDVSIRISIVFSCMFPCIRSWWRAPLSGTKMCAAQIDQRQTSREDFVSGISRFCTGLGKTVLIANLAGDFATQYLDSDLAALSTAGAWFGILMFSIQIYFDFSGYSDMAIGLARLFGFHYMENFNLSVYFPVRYRVLAALAHFFRKFFPGLCLHSHGRQPPASVLEPAGGLVFDWIVARGQLEFCTVGMYFGMLVILEKWFLLRILKKLPRFFQAICT